MGNQDIPSHRRRGYVWADRSGGQQSGPHPPFEPGWRDRYRSRLTPDDDWGSAGLIEQDWAYTRYRYWTPGPHRGIGPRNYRRSDEHIVDDVVERLTRHGQVDASDIDVAVDDGIVILTGSVNSFREKRMAEDTAASVPGVWDVSNRLRLTLAGLRYGPPSQRIPQGELQVGMPVSGAEGETIGSLSLIRQEDMLVDRPGGHDILIPLQAIRSIGERIQLKIRADQMAEQNWQTPGFSERRERGSLSK